MRLNALERVKELIKENVKFTIEKHNLLFPFNATLFLSNFPTISDD